MWICYLNVVCWKRRYDRGCRTSIYFLLAAILLAMVVPSAMADVRSSYNEDIRMVFMLEQSGRVQEAITLWEKMDNKYSNVSDGRYEDELGKLYARHSNYEAAEKAFRKGLSKSTKYTGVHYSLFLLLLQSERFDEAIALVDNGFVRFGRWPEGHLAKAQLALKNREYEKSIVEAKEALKYAEYLPAIYNVAYANFMLGRYGDSAEVYGDLLKKDPAFSINRDGVVMYALSLAHTRRYKEAIDALKNLEKHGVTDGDIKVLTSEIEGFMAKAEKRGSTLKLTP